MSVYRGELTREGVREIGSKLRIAFPKLFKGKTLQEQSQFMMLLTERLVAGGFTDERFLDAVNYVIDTFTSWTGEPSIGDFVSFDRRVKLYTPQELMTKYKDSYYVGAKVDPVAKYYAPVDVGVGEPMYASKVDIERYKLKPCERTKIRDEKSERKDEMNGKDEMRGLDKNFFSDLLKQLDIKNKIAL